MQRKGPMSPSLGVLSLTDRRCWPSCVEDVGLLWVNHTEAVEIQKWSHDAAPTGLALDQDACGSGHCLPHWGSFSIFRPAPKKPGDQFCMTSCNCFGFWAGHSFNSEQTILSPFLLSPTSLSMSLCLCLCLTLVLASACVDMLAYRFVCG